MIYLESFRLPDWGREEAFLGNDLKTKRTVYSSYYPFGVFRDRDLPEFVMEPITILYGGNGSGKSTILNLMADKLAIPRKAAYNRSDFFPDYVSLCHYEMAGYPAESRIVTSDDVFNYLLQIRHLNEDLDDERQKLFEEYNQAKYRSKGFQMRSLDDYDKLKSVVDARRKTGSGFVKERLSQNIREHSNGESAFKYFTQEVKENALYLLDEPENSMAPALQLELKQFIEDSARFFGCQFVIATHSPFLLAMEQAVIYDLDADPVRERKWTELENVRTYYQFFKEHEEELKQ